MNNHPISAVVLAIGDELVAGTRLDTNSRWIAESLIGLGVHIACHLTVADQLSEITEAMRFAADRADVIVLTGGLGPTADDVTRQAIADLAGVPLVLDPPSLRHIESIFASRNRPMPASNRVQAMLPEAAAPIGNPHGTAPGISMRVARKIGAEIDAMPSEVARQWGTEEIHIFALPGVPAEMKEMFPHVRDEVSKLLPSSRVILKHELHCFGAGESEIESMLPDLIRRGRDPQVGITASDATITLRVTTAAATVDECRGKMSPTIDTIREALGTLVFGENGQDLADSVLAILAARGETLATYEAGSAGRIAWWLNQAQSRLLKEADGLPHVYCGGLVDRCELPGVASASQSTTSRATDLPVMKSLGTCACQSVIQRAVDWGLAVGPFPEMAQSDPDRQNFLVAIASGRADLAEAAADHSVTGLHQGVPFLSRQYPFASHPAIAETRATKIALHALRKQLLLR